MKIKNKTDNAIDFLRASLGVAEKSETEGLTFKEAMSLLDCGASVSRATWEDNEYVRSTKDDGVLTLTKRTNGIAGPYKATKKDEKAKDWKYFTKRGIENG